MVHHAKPALDALDCDIIQVALTYVPIIALRGIAEKHGVDSLVTTTRAEALTRRFDGLAESLRHD